MKHLHLRAPKFWIIGLMLLLIALTTAPVSAASDEIMLLLPTLITVGCNPSEIEIPTVTILPDEGQTYNFRTIVSVAGIVYMDQLVSDFALGGIYTGDWSLYADNSGGTATGTWPLPTGQPVDVRFVFQANNGTLLWETLLTISQCDGGEIIGYKTGGASQLVQNPGFEVAGVAPQPAKWTTAVDNDKRVCNTEVNEVAHTGECAYQFTGNTNVLSSISQVYNLDGIGELGDQMRMSAWIQGKNITVGGKLRAIIKFPTAPKAVLTINVIAGTYAYTQVHSNTVNLTEAPKSVTIRAQMSSGSGKYLLDDLAVQTVANAGITPDTFSAIPPLPLPQAETGGNLRKLR